MNQYKLQLAVSAYRRELRAIVALRRAEQTLANAMTEARETREFFLEDDERVQKYGSDTFVKPAVNW